MDPLIFWIEMQSKEIEVLNAVSIGQIQGLKGVSSVSLRLGYPEDADQNPGVLDVVQN